MKHICEWCWKEFNDRRENAKYCCVDCYNKGRVKYEDKECPICWKVFHPLNGTQKFCSPQCRLEWTDYKCVCNVCQKSFLSKVPYTKYCSEGCKKEGKRKKNKEIPCLHCWEFFYPRHKWAKYCSNKCKRESRKTIQERPCPTCWKVFLPTASARVYCSQECYNIALSKRRKELTEEEQKKVIDRMQRGNKQAISSENIKYAKFLEKEWYQVSFEFHLWRYYYDLKVWDTLIEVNPFVYHSSTRAPWYAEPKSPDYHFNKIKYAIDNWYKIIVFWTNWMSKNELLHILQNIEETQQGEIRVHRFNKKAKDHILDSWQDEQDMIDKWYVKIYDAWEKYIFNSTNIN